MRFKDFFEAWTSDSTLKYQAAIDTGRAREGQIIKALQSKYDITPASDVDDLKGIDCYIKINGQIVPTQIKTAQGGDRLRFQMKTRGQPSKEMNPTAKLYACYVPRVGAIYFIPSSEIKKMLMDLNNLIETKYKQQFARNSRIELDYKGDTVFITTSSNRDNNLGSNIDAYFTISFIDSLTQSLPKFRLSI